MNYTLLIFSVVGGIGIFSILLWWITRQHFLGKMNEEVHLQEQKNLKLKTVLQYEQEKSKNLQDSLDNLNKEIKIAHEKVLTIGNKYAALNTKNQSLEKSFNLYKQETSDLREHFYKEFRYLADDILEEKSKKFSQLNKQQIEGILSPLNLKINDFEKKVEQSTKSGIAQHAALKEQINNLKELNYKITQEAENLTNALKGDVKQQGTWGEIRLEAILNSAGLTKDIHYYKEKQLKAENGQAQRPDYIVNLPDNKCLIIDSKVSMVAYSNFFASSDPNERAGFLEKHVLSVQTHIKTLGEKNYEELHEINQPDYVLLFLANEGALIAALEEKPKLYEMALERNIVIVTATTLMATLKTVSYIWKHELQNKNAQEIARQAGALYDKFVLFTSDLVKIGASLDQSQIVYGNALKKLQQGKGNLVTRAEKLKSLGARANKELPKEMKDIGSSEK